MKRKRQGRHTKKIDFYIYMIYYSKIISKDFINQMYKLLYLQKINRVSVQHGQGQEKMCAWTTIVQ